MSAPRARRCGVKVVAVLEVSPTDGGGFYQGLNAVLQMQRLCVGRHGYAVAATDAASLPVLARLGVEAFHLPTSLYERFQTWLGSGRASGRIVGRLLRPLGDVSSVEGRLLAAGADVAYFTAPWRRVHALARLPHWVTVWDLAHLDHSEFPEVSRSFHARERVLRRALGPAALVVADSAQLARRLCRRYGIDRAQVVVMPFAPSPGLSGPDCAPRDEVLRRHRLDPGYFFYPAQFWAHKNHVRVLEALRRCLDRGQRLRVAFAGGDMGGRRHVEAVTRALGLEEQVRFLGFVDTRDMRGLYEGALALVMPTYFGPTNLPPLEAWSLGVPVIYSRHLQEQAGDAALLIDPDDAKELAEAMLAMADETVRAALVERGRRRLDDVARQRGAAEAQLVDRLRRHEARLRCSAGRR